MAPAAPVQSALLAAADRCVRDLVASAQRSYERLDLLEAVACDAAGLSAEWYGASSPWSSHVSVVPGPAIAALRGLLECAPMRLPFSLAALAAPTPDATAKKKAGVYYTDFRLAEDLVSGLPVAATSPILVDLACGTGVLLAASVLRLGGSDQSLIDALLETAIHGVDLDPSALRGAALSLTSAASTARAVVGLRGHLYQKDSLRAGSAFWESLAPAGFDVVVGNPPWERLRFSRHEHLLSRGDKRLYGQSYDASGAVDLEEARVAAKEASAELKSAFNMQDRGESDLYKLFLEVALNVVRPEGRVLQLVPAGLIRSQGATALRKVILERSALTRMRIHDNKARYFAIDSRFKFLSVDLQFGPSGPAAVPMLVLANGPRSASGEGDKDVRIAAQELERLRPDMSVPEVRSPAEWLCFTKLSSAGRPFDREGGWNATFHRELDMTNDRELFRAPAGGLIPVLEGRMVHQYRHDWKRHRGGEGRAARWEAVARSEMCEFGAQFACALEDLPKSTQERVQVMRFGFCDITGQTNERTLLASAVPDGVVCGNKVPTLSFEATGGLDASQVGLLWLAMVNSFPVDWMVRRLTTTTLNFFVMRSVPLPSLPFNGPEALGLVKLAAQLTDCGHIGPEARRYGWTYAELRAEVEWRVWAAYGQDLDRLELVLSDFPLLDRGQPALDGERRSTVTRDLVLLRATESLGGKVGTIARLRERVERARSAGAVPFVPPGTPEESVEMQLIAETA